MLEQPRLGGGRLDDAAVGREVAAEDGDAAAGLAIGLVERADDVVVVDLGIGDRLARSACR